MCSGFHFGGGGAGLKYVVALFETCEGPKAYIFKVKAVANMYWDKLVYGPLPVKAGMVVGTLVGGTTTVPADGVLPPYAVVDHLKFPAPAGLSAYDSSDMWYIPRDKSDILFIYKVKLKPSWLRIEPRIPEGVDQARFLGDKNIVGAASLMGFSRGEFEVVQLANVHYGWRIANDTNLAVATRVVFEYRELRVEVVKDGRVYREFESGRLSGVYVVRLPTYILPDDMESRLEEAYGMKPVEVEVV